MQRLRSALLVLTLIFMAIPGFIGFEMHLFGVRLGLFQPFKFLFLTWMILQGIAVRSQILASIRAIPRWLFLGIFLWNGGLIAGLLAQGGGERGWGLYFALVLGQVAALLTWADPHWNHQAVKRGFFGAILLLSAFSVAEHFFTDSEFTLWVLRYLRNTAYVSTGGGSLLSTSALAEYVVRVTPFFLFTAIVSGRGFWTERLALALLFLLGLLTLQRGALLSLAIFAAVCIARLVHEKRFGPKKMIQGAAAVLVLLGLVICTKGVDATLGRYFGQFMPTRVGVIPDAQHDYVRDSQKSVLERRHYFQLGMQVFRSFPLTGVGIDGFAYRNYNKLPPLQDNPNPEGVHTHNLLLEFLVSGGIFAFWGILILWFGGVAAALTAPLHWPLLACFLGGSVSLLTDARIYVSWLAITFVWIPVILFKMPRHGVLSVPDQVDESVHVSKGTQ